jgi:hypothetical protein
MRRLSLALFFLLLAVGCEATIPEGLYACETDEDCPEDLVCRVERNRCYHTLADAGP